MPLSLKGGAARIHKGLMWPPLETTSHRALVCSLILYRKQLNCTLKMYVGPALAT